MSVISTQFLDRCCTTSSVYLLKASPCHYRILIFVTVCSELLTDFQRGYILESTILGMSVHEDIYKVQSSRL